MTVSTSTERACATSELVVDGKRHNTDSRSHALYQKAIAEQWLATTLNWNYTIDPARELVDLSRYSMIDAAALDRLGKSQRELFMALSVRDLVNDITAAEQVAMLGSCLLAQRLPDADAKIYAVSQAMDEARHLEVFSRYARRIGQESSADLYLQSVLDFLMTSKHWQGLLVGMNMLEDLAMANFSALRHATNCDLLRDLLKLVMRDEARHIAFGHHYLKSMLAAMHPDDRAEVEDFSLALVQRVRGLGTSQDDLRRMCAKLIEVGIDPRDFIRHAQAGNSHQNESAGGEPKIAKVDQIILPNLRRLGLITERVRPAYV